MFVDTNVLSKVILGHEKNYRNAWSQALDRGDVLHTSVVVYFELEYGACNSDNPATTRAKYQRALTKINTIHDLDKVDSEVAAKIRADLSKANYLPPQQPVVFKREAGGAFEPRRGQWTQDRYERAMLLLT